MTELVKEIIFPQLTIFNAVILGWALQERKQNVVNISKK